MRLLLDEKQLREGIERLAGEITRYYARRPLTVIGVLTGSLVVMADLIRRIDLPMRVGLVQARSYEGATTEPGPLILNLGMLPDVRGRDVLLVDDIFDTGQTLSTLITQLEACGTLSVRTAVLLRKRDRCQVSLEPDHVGFDIPNEFRTHTGICRMWPCWSQPTWRRDRPIDSKIPITISRIRTECGRQRDCWPITFSIHFRNSAAEAATYAPPNPANHSFARPERRREANDAARLAAAAR